MISQLDNLAPRCWLARKQVVLSGAVFRKVRGFEPLPHRALLPLVTVLVYGRLFWPEATQGAVVGAP